MRQKLTFQPVHRVAQDQAALLQPPQRQFVGRRIRGAAIDQRVQIGMFHAQFDQLSVGRVEAGFQGGSATSMAKMPQAGG
ncbi:hypothetical protein A1D30_11430 [Acidovorax sp. GW101-3H11]|nr:hypothetical protein A1D30_11430 [Acidovorax sp. GW101-3H11]